MKSFSRALHLNPSDEQLRCNDLNWSLELLEKRAAIDAEVSQQQQQESSKEALNINFTDYDKDSIDLVPVCRTSIVETTAVNEENNRPEISRIPPNYVVMRH